MKAGAPLKARAPWRRRIAVAGVCTCATVGAAGARVKRLDYFVPELGEGAEMLEGDTEEIIAKLVELLKAKGGLK